MTLRISYASLNLNPCRLPSAKTVSNCCPQRSHALNQRTTLLRKVSWRVGAANQLIISLLRKSMLHPLQNLSSLSLYFDFPAPTEDPRSFRTYHPSQRIHLTSDTEIKIWPASNESMSQLPHIFHTSRRAILWQLADCL